MSLTDRQMIILKAIISNYLETGEPVGSRTISKYTTLNLSSATIRNEMADLEEMGYIIQPHTSAGRIPSDKGYRLYVDALMAEKEQEVIEMKNLLTEKADKMERLLQQAVKLLATNTNYASMISTPTYHKNKLKFIQLSNIRNNQLLVVVVAEGNIVRNKVISLKEAIDNETLATLNILLNTNLSGEALEDISFGLITRLKEQAGAYKQIIEQVLDAVAECVRDDELQVYTSGATNILKYPELADKGTAQNLLEAFEEKKQLKELVVKSLDAENNKGIQVYIGSENDDEGMQECSVVTATYELSEGLTGTIGIVGPKRMDYENVVKALKTLKSELDDIYHDKNK